jgi:hypothetical protein
VVVTDMGPAFLEAVPGEQRTGGNVYIGGTVLAIILIVLIFVWLF